MDMSLIPRRILSFARVRQLQHAESGSATQAAIE
jgi:hypothetical protein